MALSYIVVFAPSPTLAYPDFHPLKGERKGKLWGIHQGICQSEGSKVNLLGWPISLLLLAGQNWWRWWGVLVASSIFSSQFYLVAQQETNVVHGASPADTGEDGNSQRWWGERHFWSSIGWPHPSISKEYLSTCTSNPEVGSPCCCSRKHILVLKPGAIGTCIVMRFPVILNKTLLSPQIEELRALSL